MVQIPRIRVQGGGVVDGNQSGGAVRRARDGDKGKQSEHGERECVCERGGE